MFGILSKIFRKKVAEATTEAPQRVLVKSPLGMSPGSVWSVPDLDLAVAKSDGSLIGDISGDQIVRSVGHLSLFGLDVYHVRFSDTESFVQAVTQNGNIANVKQLRLFTHNATVTPSSRDEWEFWLGRLDRDQHGNVVRDSSGRSMIVEPGLIGGDAFQIDGPPAAVYTRQWSSQDNQAVKFKEIIQDGTGSITALVHEGMEYARRLSDDQTSTVEYLFATAHGDQGHVKVYVGIDIDPTNQRVISVA